MKLTELVFRVRIVQAQHRREMARCVEALRWPPANALCGRIGIDELRMRGRDRAQLAHQRVELGVRDLGRVVDVIAFLVMANEIAKCCGAF